MLAVNQLIGFGAGGSALPTLSYRATTASATDLTTYTFSAADIGAVGGTRMVFVGINGAFPTGPRSVSSCTIDGVTATYLGVRAESAQSVCEFWAAATGSNATGDVVVVWSAGVGRCVIHVWAAYDLTSMTPNDTATSTTDPTVLNVDVQANGMILGIAATVDSSTYTWTGLTERYDAITETNAFTSADSSNMAQETNRTVTADPSGASNRSGISIALR